MKTSSINIASLGDVHIGHPRTKASHIIANLYRYLLDPLFFNQLDLLLINGDFWDQLLTLTSLAAREAEEFIGDLLWLAAKHNVIVRTLEGTPLHDCGHSSKFTSINEMARIGANVKYFNTLAIEYIPELDIHILYVPDELTTDPLKTWGLVQDLLAANNLTQVDYVSMHGAFTYQLPEQAHHNCHDPKLWLKIVRRHIFINHVHTPSQYDKIIGPGSFDRLKHSEEEPKGLVHVTDHGTHSEVKFIENQHAKLYKTFDCRGLSIEDVYTKLLPVQSYPEDSYVRITALRSDAIVNGYDALRKLYPHLNWSFKAEKSDAPVVSLLPSRYTAKTINRGNFKSVLVDKLAAMGITATDPVYPWVMNHVEKVTKDGTT